MCWGSPSLVPDDVAGPDRSVIGYIYVLAVEDHARFYEFCAMLWYPSFGCLWNRLPPFRSMIARRWGYLPGLQLFRPDAFIFTSAAVKASGLEVVRTYRLLNPECDSVNEAPSARASENVRGSF
jgi:hypothetical protein